MKQRVDFEEMYISLQANFGFSLAFFQPQLLVPR